MKILLILIKVFVIAALLIISNENLAMSSSEDRVQFISEYKIWLNQLFDHGLVVVGYVVGNEWLPNTVGK
jgi:hypothetical protein